jgi:hypothetical protein
MPIFVGTTQVTAAKVGGTPILGTYSPSDGAHVNVLGGSQGLAAPAFVNVYPGNTQADVKWGAVAGADAYAVSYRDVSTGQIYSLLEQPSGVGTYRRVGSLLAGKTYVFRVRAKAGDVFGPETESQPVTIGTTNISYAALFPAGRVVVSTGLPHWGGTCQNPFTATLDNFQDNDTSYRLWLRINTTGYLNGTLNSATKNGLGEAALFRLAGINDLSVTAAAEPNLQSPYGSAMIAGPLTGGSFGVAEAYQEQIDPYGFGVFVEEGDYLVLQHKAMSGFAGSGVPWYVGVVNLTIGECTS